MLKTEIIDEKKRGFIFFRKKSALLNYLIKALKEKNVKVFSGKVEPGKLKSFDYVFFIDPPFFEVKNLLHYFPQKVLFIYTSKTPDFLKLQRYLSKGVLPSAKLILVFSQGDWERLIDRILWFFFSSEKQNFLRIGIDSKGKIKESYKTNLWENIFVRVFNKRFLLRFLIIGFVFYNLLIWISLFASLLFLYKYRGEYFPFVKISLNFSQQLYKPARPVYHFLFLGSYSDSLQDLGLSAAALFQGLNVLRKESDTLLERFWSEDTSKNEAIQRREAFEKVKLRLRNIRKNVSFLASSPWLKFFPKDKQVEIEEASNALESFIGVFEKLDRILPETSRKYVVFFENNMELRPGGGFIGSFAIVETKYLGIKQIRFYDVYDADGQLKAVIEPPEPIKKYLGKEFWFLRDSNFSPDNFENYRVAKEFLKLELKEDDFDGMVVITMTAIENLLKAFGDIYLADYKTKINSENFYIKTQHYIHSEFFPGAINKKNFLNDLFNYLIANFDTVDLKVLFMELAQALDQKFIALFFEDEELEKLFDQLYWSGRVFPPTCLVKREEVNCIIDFLFPVEANLGVNKANFYVRKSLEVQVDFQNNGEIKTTASFLLENTASEKELFGGDYKNYFRLFLLNGLEPISLKVDSKDERIVYKPYDSSVLKGLAYLEYFIKIPMRSRKKISFVYLHPQRLKRGNNIYQLTVQKQIGSLNYDFTLKLKKGDSITFLNKNFSSVVKDKSLVYNTVLSSDKVFLIELLKE